MRRAIALFLALAISPRAAWGQSDVRVLHPVADSQVYEGKTGSNAGGDTSLRVRVKSRVSYRSFLRFDLASITGTVLSAKLRLLCTDASPDGGQLLVLSDDGWSETGITWANQPALPTAAFAALGRVYVSRWVEVDVTAALEGTPTQVFALAGGSSNSAYYSSREGSNPPELVLELSGGRPIAAFSGSPLSGAAPLMVSFTDLSSGAPTTWAWDFGDGATSADQHPAHVYDQPGTYGVQLDVTGAGGSDSLTRTDYVTVNPPPEPVADFGGTPLSGAAPLMVSFTDLSSGAPTTWAWDFGDGATSADQHPAHVYDQPGMYTVRLDVTGAGGSGSLTRSDYVSVNPPPAPVAAFSGTPLSGAAPLMVGFTDLSSGQVTDWLWQFGDGASSLEQAPVHTYTDPGIYSVSLTVTGPTGTNTLTNAAFVRVLDANARGIWTSAFELSALPMSGPAWDNVLAEANLATATPLISYQGDDTDVRVLAKALVFARTGDQRYRLEVIDACRAAIGTEQGGSTLALGRNLVAYVVSAELVGLPAQEDADFRAWLRVCLTELLENKTLISTHEIRPNNWGTHAGASRAAVALYLGDTTELERCATIFHGWLGNRSVYAGFAFGDPAWQADPSNPVAVNPMGATKEGHSIDGVLPDDQRRSGAFLWPPPKANYVWEALQGAIVQAVILHRAGYDTWNWEDQALLRAVRWLHEQCDFPAEGDDTWLPHIINCYYGTDFPAPVPSSPGKNMGWTDWNLSRP